MNFAAYCAKIHQFAVIRKIAAVLPMSSLPQLDTVSVDPLAPLTVQPHTLLTALAANRARKSVRARFPRTFPNRKTRAHSLQ